MNVRWRRRFHHLSAVDIDNPVESVYPPGTIVEVDETLLRNNPNVTQKTARVIGHCYVNRVLTYNLEFASGNQIAAPKSYVMAH
jgi:hypothetical protein